MKKKFIFIFTALILCLVIALPPQAAAGGASHLAVGTWTTNPRLIAFGEFNGQPLVWRVLEVKDENPDFDGIKTAFLLLDGLLSHGGDVVVMMRFDRTNNSFPNSEIKRWLNDGAGGFLAALADYQAYILYTTYAPGNPPRQWADRAPEGMSKVFLLSNGEALNDKYFADDTDRDASHIAWWLRSPGFEDDIATVVFVPGIVARNGSLVEAMHAVRPAFKIDISPSSVFANLPVSYGLAVKAIDENMPIRGAKFTLAPAGDAPLSVLPTQNFSNSLGMARFMNVTPGTYTLAVSKPGYKTELLSITVPAAAMPVVSLTPDPDALPDRVIFGRYNGAPIEWDVLDIVNDRALLFAGALFEGIRFDNEGSNIWAGSTMQEYLNSDVEGDPIVGFLHETNFTAAETTAMDTAASPTGDAVFLLSSEEVFSYLPDAYMRKLEHDITWLTRSPFGGEDLVAISPSGEYTVIDVLARGTTGWYRPATWVDLSMLTFDRDTNTLLGIE